MTKYKGNLELNWINKDKSLYYEYDKEGNPGKPIWVEKDDIKVSEPRILKLVKEYGDVSGLKDPLDNALIRGDNLLALKTLVEMFKEREEKDKLKCVYIDPPFNTGNAFDNYEDNLEHSEWLTMMRDRLKLIKQLIRSDGIIFVHIDYQELAYLKVLMDEIFSRKNYIGQINWQRVPEGRTLLGQGESDLTFSTEYILIYSRDRSVGKLFKDEKKFINLTENIIEQYGTILKVMPSRELIKEFKDPSDNYVKVYEEKVFEIKTLSKKLLNEDKSKYLSLFLKNYKDMVQSVGIQEESSSQQRILAECKKKDRLYLVEYVLTKGKRKGQKVESYFYNGRKFLFAKDYSKLKDGKLYRETDMNDFWRSEEIPVTGIASEGNVEFRRSKKPEALIKRILKLSSEEKDLVLDSFLGSGTTSAVAHKMNRRWIGIEIGKHADTHCVKRLNSVIDKKNPDSTGISKDENINWKGGGGFRYYTLGESLLSDHKMNWNLTYEELALALFMNFDYRFKEKLSSNVFVGKSGKNIAICIIAKEMKIIKKEELKQILDKIKGSENKKIVIYTNHGVAIKNEELPDNLTIKKIPESILKKYRL